MPANNKSVESLEKKIEAQLGIDSKDKSIDAIGEKIDGFKNNYKSMNGNNIIEFLTKTVFTNTNSKKDAVKNTLDQRKQIRDILEKEQWNKIFNLEQVRMDRYSEYDLIYSYIPELAACIDSFRDAIIAPDDLVSNTLPIVLDRELVSAENASIFEENIELIVEKYRLKEVQKNIIGDTLKLGDQFVAILKYEDEFQKFVLKEELQGLMPPEFLDPYANKKSDDEIILTESFFKNECFDSLKDIVLTEAKNNDPEVNSDEVNSYYDKIVKDIGKTINGVKIQSGKEVLSKESGRPNKSSKRIDLSSIELKGCINKKLDPKYTVKLEMDGINFGFIYAIKDQNNAGRERDTMVKDFFSSRTNIESNMQGKAKEDVIATIFGKGIAKKMDLEFIENNKDYKELIYLLLKNEDLQNSSVSFAYFAPDEVIHFAIDKEDIYGTSRMAKSLFSAKLYIPSVLNEFMQKISRGRDKRVVYAEVGLDEDTEGSIQEVVRDIKSKELTTDQLQNLSTILRTVGNFDDYYIPLFDGEKNIEFDTIAGMDVSSDREWNEFLLKSVIKGTGFPSNYIDASQEVDFARTVIMQNQLLVRKIVSDQETFAKPMGELVKRIYEYEFGKNNIDSSNAEEEDSVKEILKAISVVYPKPMSLNLTNVNEQISNATQTIDFVVAQYIDDNSTEDDDAKKKVLFKKKIAKKLIPGLDWEDFDEIFDSISIEVKEQSIKDKAHPVANADGMGGEDDMDY